MNGRRQRLHVWGLHVSWPPVAVWLNIAGHKPLAHLPRWQRHLLHLPSVRWRLWPRPWNFNGPVMGYRAAVRRQQAVLAELIPHLPDDLRVPTVCAVLDVAAARTWRQAYNAQQAVIYDCSVHVPYDVQEGIFARHA